LLNTNVRSEYSSYQEAIEKGFWAEPFFQRPGQDLILEDSAVPTKNTSPNDTAALLGYYNLTYEQRLISGSSFHI
jgi:hypothetical protein